MAWQHLADAARRVAHCTTGHVTPQAQVSARSVAYNYLVQKQIFHISAAAYRALIAGTYHVYYTPASKTVLSVVPVAGGRPPREG